MNDFNPLNLLRHREINFISPHFVKIKLEVVNGSYDNYKELKKWVYDKLCGRFFIKSIPILDDFNKIKSQTYIGFEDHKELTYFILTCPFIRR